MFPFVMPEKGIFLLVVAGAIIGWATAAFALYTVIRFFLF